MYGISTVLTNGWFFNGKCRQLLPYMDRMGKRDQIDSLGFFNMGCNLLLIPQV